MSEKEKMAAPTKMKVVPSIAFKMLNAKNSDDIEG